jgi:choline transport protein
MTMAIGLLAFLVVGFGTRWPPLLEGAILLLFVSGFFGVLIPIWTLAPMAPAKEVFTSFSNFGGWSSIGVACIVGQISPVGAFIGADSPVHMAEEVRNASLTVPRMMMAAVMLNGTIGFVLIITYVFAIQDVQQQIVDSTAAFPFTGVFEDAVGSREGAVSMTAAVIVLSFCICVSEYRQQLKLWLDLC